MERELRFPRSNPYDRNYWLCRCEGFRVEAEGRVVGVVAELRFRRFHDRPDQLLVLGGTFGTRRTLVEVEDVLEVEPRRLQLKVRLPEQHDRPMMIPHLLERIRQLRHREDSQPADA
jgi:hypothetical protein